MSAGISGIDATVQERWEQTLAATHAPDHTISTNLEETRRLTKTSFAEGFRRLGYQLGAELGRGGMGLVNVANQQVFDREVAIKRLLGGEANRDAAMKFFAEALVTAQLEHPHIVPIHDLMANADGQLQLVMKRVEGLSWRDLLHPRTDVHRQRAADFTLDDHLDILLKVCDALSFAHGRGFLHRDVKPENVMIGSYGEVLVMDWGCAVAFGDCAHHPVVPRVDEISHIAGTPSYMAPEMVLIQADQIGPHSDVYLLGATLYEVLTLTKPNRGDNVYAVLRDAVAGTVIPPAEAAPEREVPDELADICLEALAKDPTTRIQEVGILAGRLRDYRRHAQAITLAQLAERLLDEASRLGTGARAQARADDGLRRAVAAAENSCELWPGWSAGHALAARATIAHAHHCLSTGGAVQAQSLAQRAAPHARAAGDERVTGQAKALAEQARRQGKAAHLRERTLRITRWAILGLAVVMVAGSLIAISVISGKQHEAETERAHAVAALADLTHEQDQRHADQRKYAPGLVAQAKAGIVSEHLADAAEALSGALAFDPELVDAMMLQANVVAALGRYDAALPVAKKWQASAPTDANAKELVGLCSLAGTQDSKVISSRCADLFMREHLPTLAQSGLRSNADRLVAYQARLEQFVPGASAGLQINDEGTLGFSWDAKGLRHRQTLVDLSPLRGMPFRDLNLSDTGVVDLSPLADMPLHSLNINDTKIHDLSPLRHCPLEDLSACGCSIDVATLAGFRLTKFWAYNNTQITRIDALHGMPLTDLNLSGCRVEDLAPLAEGKLGRLEIDGSFTSLEPLRGMPLKEPRLFGAFSLLAPLAQSPLHALTISSTVPIDLSGLPVEHLDHLDLGSGCHFSDPRQLVVLQPVALYLDGYHNENLDWIRLLDLSRLTELGISHCSSVSLAPFAKAPLQSVDIRGYNDGLDCSTLAALSMTKLMVSEDAQTWRSLATLRHHPTLTQFEVRGRISSATEFWSKYDPELPGFIPPTVKDDDGPPRLSDKPVATAPGLAYEACLGNWSTVNDLAKATVIKQGVAPLPDVTLLPEPEYAGLRFTGFIAVPKDGLYRFILSSDDGSRLCIGDRIIADNDGSHGQRPIIGTMQLKAGMHAMSLLYFQGNGGSALSLNVQGPDQPWLPVPATWFCHATH